MALDFDPMQVLRERLQNVAAGLRANGLPPAKIAEQLGKISTRKRYSLDEVQVLLAGFDARAKDR